MRTKLTLFAKGSPFGGAVERSETERVRPCKQTLSVTASGRATSPERERLWRRRKVSPSPADRYKAETSRPCQGLPLRGSCRRRRLRGFVPASKPSPSRPLAVPPLPKGRGFGREGSSLQETPGPFKGPGVSRFISLGVCALIPLRPGRRVLLRRLRPQPPSQPAPPQSALRRLHPAPPSRPVLRRRARCGPAPSPYRPRPGA